MGAIHPKESCWKMTDTDKLKRLAEAIAAEEYSVGSGGFVVNQHGRAVADFLPMPDPDDYKSAPTLSDALGRARYFVAAHPSAILALIAENEAKDRLNTELREANNQYRDRYIAAEGALRQISADPHRDPVAIADDVLARIDAK